MFNLQWWIGYAIYMVVCMIAYVFCGLASITATYWFFVAISLPLYAAAIRIVVRDKYPLRWFLVVLLALLPFVPLLNVVLGLGVMPWVVLAL